MATTPTTTSPYTISLNYRSNGTFRSYAVVLGTRVVCVACTWDEVQAYLARQR